LIVDDIKANRSLVKAYLDGTPIRFIEAENGEEAVAVVEAEKPDLILMDIRMPVMDGCDATRHIRSSGGMSHIPIIALTASGMKSDQERIMRCGFDGLLTKPFHKNDLLRRLSHFIPYRKIGDPEPAADEKPADREKRLQISGRGRIYLPELLEKLEKEFTPLWQKAKQDGFFDDIADFGEKMAVLGKSFESPGLQALGDELKVQVANFDIEKINQLLDDYPKMIQKYKTLLAHARGEGTRASR